MDASRIAEAIRDKAALERNLGGDDPNWGQKLLGVLSNLNRMSVGTLDFNWADHPHPLHFRCGTSDLANFSQMFVNKEYEIPIPSAPRRILDLGGYVGYASAYLAKRFPDAQLVSVEPSADNFRINGMNTAAFSNVRRVNAGVSDITGTIGASGSIGGDWGATFAAGHGTIPCYSIPDLMKVIGWNWFDFLKCDIEGAEREVFRHSGSLIASNVNVCAVEIHDVMPGAHEAVYDCFDKNIFDNFRNGEFHCFMRREFKTIPTEELVLRPASGLRPIELVDVPTEPWGFYIFDGSSCQIHPGDRNGAPATLKTALDLTGQSRFEAEVSVSNSMGHPVRFIVELLSEDGHRVFSESQLVEAGERLPIRGHSKPLSGRFQIKLSTQMSEISPTSHTAYANWHAPLFR